LTNTTQEFLQNKSSPARLLFFVLLLAFRVLCAVALVIARLLGGFFAQFVFFAVLKKAFWSQPSLYLALMLPVPRSPCLSRAAA
jgi:hypothetical protein